MGLYPIKQRVVVVCCECNKEHIAKRVDTKYCPPCGKAVRVRQSNASRAKRREYVNASARERTARMTAEQKERRLENQRRRRWNKIYGLTVPV